MVVKLQAIGGPQLWPLMSPIGCTYCSVYIMLERTAKDYKSWSDTKDVLQDCWRHAAENSDRLSYMGLVAIILIIPLQIDAPTPTTDGWSPRATEQVPKGCMWPWGLKLVARIQLYVFWKINAQCYHRSDILLNLLHVFLAVSWKPLLCKQVYDSYVIYVKPFFNLYVWTIT